MIYQTAEFIEKYLNLIHAPSLKSLDLDSLGELQTRHIERLNWSTVDLFLKRKIHFDAPTILDKYIIEQPGGICYELNGSFCYLLQQLGFDAYLSSTRLFANNDIELNFDIDTHAVIVLKLNNQHYLLDVAWLDSYRKPILLKDQTYVADIGGEFRICTQQPNQFQLEKFFANQWRKQYSFSLKPQPFTTFHHNLASGYDDPDCEIYFKCLHCTYSNPEGYYLLRNKVLETKKKQQVEKRPIENPEEIRRLLKDQFKINEQLINAIMTKLMCLLTSV